MLRRVKGSQCVGQARRQRLHLNHKGRERRCRLEAGRNHASRAGGMLCSRQAPELRRRPCYHMGRYMCPLADPTRVVSAATPWCSEAAEALHRLCTCKGSARGASSQKASSKHRPGSEWRSAHCHVKNNCQGTPLHGHHRSALYPAPTCASRASRLSAMDSWCSTAARLAQKPSRPASRACRPEAASISSAVSLEEAAYAWGIGQARGQQHRLWHTNNNTASQGRLALPYAVSRLSRCMLPLKLRCKVQLPPT